MLNIRFKPQIFQAYDSVLGHHCQRSKKRFTWYVISIIAENHKITRPFAYNESLQHPTIAVLLIKILFFFHYSVELTFPKEIYAIKR